ncbi:MAG: hypothetical protein M1825_005575 [Sarcosagium campestre]|nr:MAG: hypothetical protein M1825_005575 [Sarcosagium campestre]
MAPQSRGKKKSGVQLLQSSSSTPNLPTFSNFDDSISSETTSPSSITAAAAESATSPARTPTTTTAAVVPDALAATYTLSPSDKGYDEADYDDADADFPSSQYLGESGSSGSASLSDSDTTPPVKRNLPGQLPPLPRAQSFLGPNAFAPPFYGRPPTPLPPSPSLTSLLRPPFSTTTSRPSTPDSSDVDTPNDTEAAAVAKSARTATTVPRASPKVPTYEYYGFVLYLISSLAFLIYLLWSYLPMPFLHQLGIYYYPNRWWSLAIPSFLVMLLVYIYVALASYNTGYLTLPMNSIENVVDDAAHIAVLDKKQRLAIGATSRGGINAVALDSQADWVAAWNEGTDAVMDIPVGGVCEILYAS